MSAPGVFLDESLVALAPWLAGPAALVGIIGIGVFALLPVLIGFSAVERFGGSPYLGGAMGAALVAAPFIVDSGAFPALQLQGGGSWTLAGIDVLGVDYRGTVVPVIVVSAVLAAIERGLRRSLRGAAAFLFVPMLTLLDTPPETAQAIFRIADSGSTAITPMSPYFIMALGFMQKYQKNAGIGTLASHTLPLAICMTISWSLLFFAWWGLGIPLGPGAPVR